jgi:hypothetical protein
MSDADPAEFTRPASEVLRDVVARLPSAATVWDEICEVSLLTLAGMFPSILSCLPQNGGAQLRARLLDGAAPALAGPRADRGLMYLRTRNEYPFIGAVQRRKALKKKRKGKGKKGKKRKGSVEPEFEADGLPEPEPEAEPPKDHLLTQAQHYFHIVGIDIILDARGHPKLLELNDRPSLQVTAPFEAALKEGMITEAFSHLSLDGSSFGANAGSKWQQILPVPPGSELAAPIRSIMQHQSELKIKKKTAMNSPVAQRMMEAGVRTDAHDLLRARFLPVMSAAPGKEGYAVEEVC